MTISAPKRPTSLSRDQDPQRLGTVAVIEDDPGIRVMVADLISDVGFQVEVFASAVEYLTSYPGVEPSCILLDVRLQGMSGLELQHRLTVMGSRSMIVFMTGFAEVSMSVRAMKAGAFDFLQKPFREQEVIDAIFAADLEYRRCATINTSMAAIDRRFHSLTSREREVLEGVIDGLLNKQIAAMLGISEITVKVHRANLMRKMQAKTLVDLVKDVSMHFSLRRASSVAGPTEIKVLSTGTRARDIRSPAMQIFA